MRTHEEYEDKAVALANRADELGSLKQRLRDNRDNCPLFDSARFTRHIEEAYQQVMQRYWAGLAADNVSVTGKSTGTPVVYEGGGHKTIEKSLFISESLSDSDESFRLFAHRADADVGGSPPSVSI
jgi:hypothetical protein